MSHVLVIGNGPAAHRLTERLHHHSHGGAITVLGAEPRPAYNRVLLGAVVAGTLSPEAVTLPTPPQGTEFVLGVTATEVDRARRLVHTDTGVTYRYDELVLATGSRPQVPGIPGILGSGGDLAEGVTTLRTLDDCGRITGATGHIVVLGGGILGIEAAHALLRAGREVTLVHPRPYPMDRQLDAACGRLLADHLSRLGITTRLGRTATEYQPGELVLDDGEVIKADTLVLCTGVSPETDLARKAGLAVRDGIVVDDRLATDDPHVHALGDCAEHRGDVPGLMTPAWEQADVLAERLTGTDARYRRTEVVFRLKARGLDLASFGSLDCLHSPDAGVELVTLSDPARGRYAKLALRDQRVSGAVLLGFPQAIASISQLHDRGSPVPSDRLGLLLGTAAGTARDASAELPDDAVICQCNNVTKKALARAWHDGAREVAGLAKATRATTGCGTCTEDVRRICGSLQATTGTDMTEQEGAA